ncbi:MAG TPA: hypothetical protein ENJ89_11465 [Caldithrix abyssi]|uniref:SGNH/GDSL hydrolase family protein n=1 Tax=Caldithrix abyssi TaxID=187145 RepID=A0A7V5UFX3_CALAY|nr:hypothetical protein [Caldithrix abyssi]
MKYIKILFVMILPMLLVLSGCQLEEPAVTKTVTNLKGKTIKTYVAIGNSLTAGVQSGGLAEDFQMFSFPNLLAKQLEIESFAQPTISYPGIPAVLELDPITSQLISAPGTGVPTNLNYQGPYQNLGIPTATTWDMLFAKDSTSNFRYLFFGETNPAVDLVLRNPAMGNTTVFQQAKMQQPDLVTVWIGNNDVLGYATSGGLKPITPISDFTSPFTGVPLLGFQNAYMALMDSVKSLNAMVALANIPDVTAIPFFKVVGPQIAASFKAAGIPYPLSYEKGSDDLSTGIATGQATTDDLANFNVLVTLVGASYAGEIGKPSGKWYRDLAAMKGVPVSALLATMPVVDTTQAFGLHPQNPWPSALILDADEIANIKAATVAYNQIIAAAAAQYGFALFDANAFMNQVSETGIMEQGFYFTAEFANGGVFSLDGIHPSNAGYAIIANKFIAALNETYNMAIAQVMLNDVLGHAPVKKAAVQKMNYDLFKLAPVLEMTGGKIW